MKARLYRGPSDGKIIDVPNHEKTIITSHIEDIRSYPASGYPTQIPVVNAYYHITPHTHPDGSVFFEWEKPRGAKSGVKTKRRSRRKPKMVHGQSIYVTDMTTGAITNTSGLTFTTGPYNISQP